MLTSRIENIINFSMRGSYHAVGSDSPPETPRYLRAQFHREETFRKEYVKLEYRHLVSRLNMRNVLNGTIIGIEQPLKEMDLKIGVFNSSAGQFVLSLASNLPMDWLSESLCESASIFMFLISPRKL